MTRKSSSDKKDGEKGSKNESRDYMKLKTLLESFIEGGCHSYHEDLDDILHDTAKTGIVRMPWKLLKPLLQYKLDKCINEAFTGGASLKDDNMPKQLMEMMDKFEGPPFTIQRLCELLLEPCQHYKRREKYMRALEKNLLVVSTQEPDLLWMKAPNLTTLLEGKPKPSIDKLPSINSPDPILDKQPVMMESSTRDLPVSPTWKLTRPSLSPRSRTPPPDLESLSSPTRNWEGLLGNQFVGASFFSRKRSLRSRDEGSHVELQEADSTVSDHPTQEETKDGRHDDDDETDIIKALLGGFEEEETKQSPKSLKSDTTVNKGEGLNKVTVGDKSCDDHMTTTEDTSKSPENLSCPPSSVESDEAMDTN